MGKQVSIQMPTIRTVWRAIVVGTIVSWLFFYLMGIFAPAVNPWRPMSNKDPWTNDCQKIERVAAESPDGAWRAVTVDLSCVRSGVARSWTVVAIVRSGEQPSEGDDILSLGNIYGSTESQTRLEWSGARSLTVTLPQEADIFDYTPVVGRFNVDIKIDPTRAIGR